MKAKLMVLMMVCAMFLAGCSSTRVTSPTGWTVDIQRGMLSTNFDKGELTVDPNGTIHLLLENYKSDSQQAMELAGKVIATSAGVGVIAAKP